MQRQTRQSYMPCKGKQNSLKYHAKGNKAVKNAMQRQTRQSKMPCKGKQDSLKCHAKSNKTV